MTRLRTKTVETIGGLGGLAVDGPWVEYFGKRSSRTHLQIVPDEDVAPRVRREAALQARQIAEHYRCEGYSEFAGTGPEWIWVLWTLAIRLRSWDSCFRHIRAGLAMRGGGTWRGWFALLGQDPSYALRRSFLLATWHGWGARRGSRYEDGLAWRPLDQENVELWEAWIAGRAPEPEP